jgi:hypothetical protein
MSSSTPDHHDAELVLKVYDLRRDPTMRESRNALNGKFWPTSFGDIEAVVRADHPFNAAWRQMSTFWEMVYGIARHGIVHPEYWMESNGEGLLLFAKIYPWLDDMRREISPVAFRNAEWVATQTEEGRRIFAAFQARIEKMREMRQG